LRKQLFPRSLLQSCDTFLQFLNDDRNFVELLKSRPEVTANPFLDVIRCFAILR
jgi:hypothetical protein